jgi:hypothetical protein
MQNDERDLWNVLNVALKFLDDGGRGRSLKTRSRHRKDLK